LATHKPTQEKIKTPHRTKKNEFAHPHFAHLALPRPQADPSQNQKSKIFLPHGKKKHNYFYI